MRVLLDECVPRKLKRELQGHDVLTVTECGWSGVKNGQLLTLAEGEFDVFLTIDQNLKYQQALKAYKLGVILLSARNNRLRTLLPLMPEVRGWLENIKAGDFVRVISHAGSESCPADSTQGEQTMSTIAPPRRPEIKTELPGPRGREIIAADAEFVTPSYPRPDYKLVAERGEGVWVTDVDGNVFLDCNAGVAVCSTGHCHPEVVRAIQDQAAKLIHMCGTDFYYEHMPALARKLGEIVPIEGPTRTHFANSGTEAVETALKLAMHKTGRQKFIAFFNSFHGRTLGSLSLTSSRVAQRRGFRRSALDVTHVPYPNAFRHPFTGERSDGATVSAAVLDWIENRLFKTTTPADEVAAVVVEVVQGEGGYVPAPREFLDGLRRVCDENGILLVVDEVQSGMGRTGKMFASEHYDLRADIVTIAKGIGSGLPIGACVARADVMDWGPGAHASTFGGNPVCIAAALKTIELLEGGLIQNAAEVGAHLKAGLERLMQKHDCIGDVRGYGMMLGVEFVSDRASLAPAPELRDRVEYACYERGLIILGAGANTIRWSPALVLTREQADVALEIFDEAITAARR